MAALLEIEGLSTGYDGVPVVRDLDLHVDEGEVVALLGPNGAGKTTTLLTDVGAAARSSTGDIRLFGKSVKGRRPHLVARDGLAHVPEDRSLFFGLTVRENLRLGAAKGSADIDQALEYFPALEPILSPPGRPAVRGRAADAGHGPGADRAAPAADGGRDEPRPGADHRGAAAAGAALDRRLDGRRRAGRRAARPPGAGGRRPRLRAVPRQPGAGGLGGRAVGQPAPAGVQLPRPVGDRGGRGGAGGDRGARGAGRGRAAGRRRGPSGAGGQELPPPIPPAPPAPA